MPVGKEWTLAKFSGAWLHGSPRPLTALRPASTVTPERAMAEAFSHKPARVFTDEHGAIRYNGCADGYFYRVDEAVGADDVEHGQGPEWHTRRPLRVALLGPTRVVGDALLSAVEEAGLRRLVVAQPRGDRP